MAKAKYGDDYPPEVRLRSARWGIPLVPAGLLIFGWGIGKKDLLAVPLVGGFTFGVGLMLTNGTIMAYFVDVVPGQTASVVASYNAIRNILAGLVAAVTTTAITSSLRVKWFMTILAAVCLMSSIALEIVQVFGPHWRQERRLRIEVARARTDAAKTSPSDKQ